MPQACNFIKKGDYDTGVFMWFQRIFKNTFFSVHLQTTASEFTNENKASENEVSNWWFYLFWSFIYKSYCIVTIIRRPANEFIKTC